MKSKDARSADGHGALVQAWIDSWMMECATIKNGTADDVDRIITVPDTESPAPQEGADHARR